MKFSTSEFETLLVKVDGLGTHYIEGDPSVPYNEVLDHILDYAIDVYDIPEEELAIHQNQLNHTRIKSLLEREVRCWLIKHSCLDKEDIMDHYRSVMSSLYKENLVCYHASLEKMKSLLS